MDDIILETLDKGDGTYREDLDFDIEKTFPEAVKRRHLKLQANA